MASYEVNNHITLQANGISIRNICIVSLMVKVFMD